MGISKNDYYTIKIEDIGDKGEGIGKYEGYTIFVKDAYVEDEVKVKLTKVKKNYAFGRLIEIIKPSPYRIEPPCEVYKQCGGCQIQGLDYDKQLVFKEKKVKDALERIGKLKNININTIIGMEHPFFYRNKSQYPVKRDNEGNLKIGFYATRSHHVIEHEKCYIGNPVNESIIEIIKQYVHNNNISIYDEENHKGLMRHILIRAGHFTKEIMVCIVINGKDLPQKDQVIKALTTIPNMKSISVNINTEKTNVILGHQTKKLWGTDYILDTLGNITYQISPQSFYQVNTVQTEKLYNKVLEYAQIKGDETIWDIYCGIGTITLYLAQKAKKVYGVEIVKEAIEDARKNAQMNNINNVEFYTGKAEDVIPRKYNEEGIYADTIVVDPPRKGCDESVLKTIVDISPKKMIYVSCDPSTLARDLKYLCENGFEVKEVQPVDMFGHTVHVECVVLMRHCGLASEK
ncbi:23S rRNA (uracil1939-C5)-methyltransferase [Natranaerovirga hydrolytica]|uniref:23S rRNA (Uracil1939-C5)-methyltransferase n=1 Tax=Natranaerovirga hydrolytica TaxID=680378 RepID=A0A4R1MDD8_9FIRM|nr:23S rRNA (uracil(1939)-C(5))-methyltransferase RlmD [Natranaerovirga hydrolytica]TCK89044.1 23S rRNA (uracil1939-C5)-methyltransferase [Natranaerovirga hydrolytica]